MEKFCDNPHCICHVEIVAGFKYRMVKDANGEHRTVTRSRQGGKNEIGRASCRERVSSSG
jgi:hypothetical protein